MKISKGIDSTTLAIGVVVKGYKAGKYDICICEVESEIVVNKRMKLIFYRTLKAAVNVDHLSCLFIAKQLSISS